MVVQKSTCGTVMLISGTCFTIITIVFVAVSLSTDYWLDYKVNRGGLTTNQKNAYATNGRYTYSRHRGLFRECYPGNDTDNFLAAMESKVVDTQCFRVDMDIPDSSASNLSNDFLARIHLLRSCIAFIAVGIFLAIVTFIVGLVPLSCSRRSKWAFTAGFLSFLVAFFVAAGIAFFHGAEYLEKRKITDVVENYKFYQSWDNEIKVATDTDYSWSYALGWVGVGFAIITAIFYVIAGFYVGDERYEDREYLEKGRGRDYMPNGYENRAYANDRPYVPYPYPAPVPYGPYIQDLDSGRQLPPMWSWN